MQYILTIENIKKMKLQAYFFSLVGMVVFASCTSTQQVATSEYDDVYYTSSDYTERTVPDRQSSFADRNGRDARYYEDGYRAYDEDDFYYSRRLRRFDRANNNAWRYYDPFFTNDLYFVMGTPYWNRWNNMGWYNWNRPRFGAGFSMAFGDPLWGPRAAFVDPFAFNSFNYYNPWVNSYYGFDPYFGYGFNNFGFNNRFINPYRGFGGFGGFGSSYLYCPPTAYVSSAAFRRVNVARRASLSGVRSQTGFQRTTPSTTSRTVNPNGTTSRRANNVPRTTSRNNYLTPKTQTEKAATLSSVDRRRNAVRRQNSRRLQQVERRSTTNSRTYPARRSGVNTSRRTPYTNRRSTVPTNTRSRSTLPSRNQNRMSSPSSRRSPSYNRSTRPSSSRSRTPSMSRPSSSRSSSSRPSSSRSSSSRSSSSRRPPQ